MSAGWIVISEIRLERGRSIRYVRRRIIESEHGAKEGKNAPVDSSVCYRCPDSGPVIPIFDQQRLWGLSETSRGMSLVSLGARYSSTCVLRSRLIFDGQEQHTSIWSWSSTYSLARVVSLTIPFIGELEERIVQVTHRSLLEVVLLSIRRKMMTAHLKSLLAWPNKEDWNEQVISGGGITQMSYCVWRESPGRQKLKLIQLRMYTSGR